MALYQFISDNLDYPDNASRKGIQGTVYTQFFIDEEGNVIEPTIVRGIDLELDAEALRLVKLMPKWQPGIQRGKPVRVRFTMPLIFKITGGNIPQTTHDTVSTSPFDGSIGVYLATGYNPLFGSFSDYLGHQGLIEFGTHFSVNRLNFMLDIEFSFGSKTKQEFEANGHWRKGRSVGILSPHVLVGYEVWKKNKWSIVPYGGLSLNGFLPSKLEKSDPKGGFQLDNTSFATGAMALFRYRYKDRGPSRFNTSLLRFRIGYNYMRFNDFLKGSSLAFSVGWGREFRGKPNR